MDFAITVNKTGQGEMSYGKSSGLFNNVYLSLTINQGDWWLDPTFGLKKRPRQKNTPRVAGLIKGDIENALQWLLDTGRATSVNVAMQSDVTEDRTRLKARISVTAANGQVVTFDKFFEVV